MISAHQWPGVVEAYRDWLPVSEATPVATLNEGGTRLIEARNVGAKLFGGRLKIHLKFEGLNPTGSFKDRGMTMAISKAAEEGAEAVMCASTGNTSASAAAYAARAGMRCAVLIPEGKIALGKLSQALIHGARVIAIRGNFDEALALARTLCDKYPVKLVNSVNPMRIEGQKTGAFEIVEALGDAPDIHALPVGNAGNITAYWKGYKEWRAAGKCSRLPRMVGFQAEGSAPIVRGHVVEKPETLATAIRIGNPASWKQAEDARDESGGLIGMASDEAIIEAYKALAALDGVFAEPSSAVWIAGMKALFDKGFFDQAFEEAGRPLVVAGTLTGHGLKDPDAAIKASGGIVEVDPTEEAVVDAALGKGASRA
jgi:threonine synthase